MLDELRKSPMLVEANWAGFNGHYQSFMAIGYVSPTDGGFGVQQKSLISSMAVQRVATHAISKRIAECGADN